jgi:hypothetical protein
MANHLGLRSAVPLAVHCLAAMLPRHVRALPLRWSRVWAGFRCTRAGRIWRRAAAGLAAGSTMEAGMAPGGMMAAGATSVRTHPVADVAVAPDSGGRVRATVSGSATGSAINQAAEISVPDAATSIPSPRRSPGQQLASPLMLARRRHVVSLPASALRSRTTTNFPPPPSAQGHR